MPLLKSQPRKHLQPTSLALLLRTFLRPQNSLQHLKRLLMRLRPFRKLLRLLRSQNNQPSLSSLLLTVLSSLTLPLRKLFPLPRSPLPNLLLQPRLPLLLSKHQSSNS